MAVGLDTHGHTTTAGATSFTLSYTCGASATAICCLFAFQNATFPTFTAGPAYNGVAMTAITSTLIQETGGGSASEQWYGLVNPATGAPHNITATWTGTNAAVLEAISFTGTNTTGGNTTFPHGITQQANATTNTITVTTANGNMTVGGWCDDGGTAISSTSATQDFVDNATNNAAMNHTASTTTSNSMSVTIGAIDVSLGSCFDVVAGGAADVLQTQGLM